MSEFDGFEVLLPALIGAAGGGESAQGGTKALGFHQGVVEAWNALTGTNTIRINGNAFTNLRTLVGSEGGLMRPGDAVALLRFQTTYFVLGRITAPGVEQRALGVQSATVSAGQGTASDAFTDLATAGPAVTVHIGSTRRCLVILSALVQGDASDIAFMGVTVTGASTIAATEFNALASSGLTFVGASRVVALTASDGLNEGSNTFTAKYKTSAGGGGTGSWWNRQIVVMPF